MDKIIEWKLIIVSSLGNSYYYISFTNDETRKTWDYCIKKNTMSLVLLRNGKL